MDKETMDILEELLTVKPKRYTASEFIKHTQENSDKFIHYCEVIVDSTGYIYCGASHMETMIMMYCDKHNCTREELNKQIPQDYWFGVDEYLMGELNCIMVYYDFIRTIKRPNTYQERTLNKLIKEGLILNKEVENESRNEG